MRCVPYWILREVSNLMVEAANFFIRSPTKISPFHDTSFQHAAELMEAFLRERYTRHSLVDQASFQSVMAENGGRAKSVEV